MRPSSACLPFASLSALAVALWSPSAAAFERQWHAGASFGYALASDGSGTRSGYGGGLHLTYGLTDAWNGLVEVDFTAHPGSLGDTYILSASGGAAYVLDILQWVPYAGAMIGAYDVWTDVPGCGAAVGPACHTPKLGLSIPFGLDYQLSRDVAVGFAGRYHVLLIDGTVNYLTLLGRVEYIWGF